MEVMNIFRIRREERWLFAVSLIVMLFLQYLIISRFWFLFADYNDENWSVFMRNFHMSGFDPITYTELTEWGFHYDILRHPLLPFFVWPLYVVNQFLWFLTGCNCVQIVSAIPLVFCSVYSEVFLYRIMRNIVRVGTIISGVLSLMFMGFAYIVVSMIVPDHFCISLFLLLFSIYIAGIKMRAGEVFSWRESALLFTVTAGVTLSNGVIVFIVIAFVNMKQMGDKRFLLRSFVLPTILLVAVALASNNIAQPYSVTTADQVGAQFNSTDYKTSVLDTSVENFFGESLQLHRKFLLADVLTIRPVVVRYSWKAQYFVEGFIVLLFLGGIVAGRRERFVWMLSSVFLFNILLHLVLAFAITEVYITTAHWAYVLPIVSAYVFKHIKRKTAIPIFALLVGITVYLWTYHVFLLFRYLTWPVAA